MPWTGTAAELGRADRGVETPQVRDLEGWLGRQAVDDAGLDDHRPHFERDALQPEARSAVALADGVAATLRATGVQRGDHAPTAGGAGGVVVALGLDTANEPPVGTCERGPGPAGHVERPQVAHLDVAGRQRSAVCPRDRELAVELVVADALGWCGRGRVAEPPRGEPVGTDQGRPDVALPDGPAVARRVLVRTHRRQAVHELRLELLATGAGGELERVAGLTQDLDRLETCAVGEEPAAAAEREQHVPLHLEQDEATPHVGRAQRRGAALLHERDPGVRSDSEHFGVLVPRLPRIAEEPAGLGLEHRGQAVAQPVQRLTQRCAPRLVPPMAPTGAVPAVAPPPFDAVPAAPRARDEQLGLVLGRVRRDERADATHTDGGVGREDLQCPAERHLAEPVVMAERLPVGRDGHESSVRVVGQRAPEPVREARPVAEELVVERGRPRQLAVERADGDRPTRREPDRVGDERVDPGDGRPPRDAARRTGPRDLVLADDGEADPGRGERLERGDVDGRLREPHAPGVAAESTAEVGDPPPDERLAVARRREREDRVRVRLGDRVPVSVAAHRRRVRGADRIVDVGCMLLEPRVECRTDVEADLLEEVRRRRDQPTFVEQAGSRQWAVALGGDAFVPVVERRRADLSGHRPERRDFPRRLIEMQVHRDVPVHCDVRVPVHDGTSRGARDARARRRNTMPSGGRPNSSANGRPWAPSASASMSGAIGYPLPPYSPSSLLASRSQWPPCGTPIRNPSRGTGVKFATIRTGSSRSWPMRNHDNTLASRSEQSTHSNPRPSRSSWCRPGASRWMWLSCLTHREIPWWSSYWRRCHGRLCSWSHSSCAPKSAPMKSSFLPGTPCW